MPVNARIEVEKIRPLPMYCGNTVKRVYRRRTGQRPVKVMALSNGEYLPLDGVVQCSSTHIDASVLEPEEVSRKLSMDIFLTKSKGRLSVADTMKFWTLLIIVYREWDKQRQRAPTRAELDALAAKRLGIGVSRLQMIRYIARHAAPELIRLIDCGEKPVKTAYKELNGSQNAQAAEDTIEVTDAAAISIPVADIRLCRPANARDESIETLALDVIDGGMKTPVKVMRLSNYEYLMLDGNRRLMAAREIGMAEVMAEIYSPDQAKRVMDQVVADHNLAGRVTVYDQYTLYKTLIAVYRENRRRECRNPTARERIYREIECDVAAKMRVSRDKIGMIVNLINHASEEAIRGVDTGEISLRAARLATVCPAVYTKPTTDAQSASSSRVEELEEKVRQEYYRANLAEAKVRDLEERQWNQIYHRDSIISALKAQVSALQGQLGHAAAPDDLPEESIRSEMS